MPFTKTDPKDVTVHWSDAGGARETICGLEVGFVYKGAAVPMMKHNETLRACGRCVKSLEKDHREITETLNRYAEIG